MVTDTLKTIEEKMRRTGQGLKTELATLRTGRASPALVEHLKVEYSGTMMPLNQVAGISSPEAKLLVVQPWDRSVISNIVKAIQKSDLSLTPLSDGTVIRINIPPLTEERRRELVKAVRARVEERKTALRNLRHEAVNSLKEKERNKEISQDEHKRALNQLQKTTDAVIALVEQIGRDKEAELAEV